jgi:hypothetical protein
MVVRCRMIADETWLTDRESVPAVRA